MGMKKESGDEIDSGCFYYFSMGSTYILYIHGSDWYIIKGGERSAGYG